MKQIDVLFLPFFLLSLLVLALAILAWAKFRKLEKPCDDIPAQYEDFEAGFYSPEM